MPKKIFLNGKLVSPKEANISIFDHGVLYGDGVFEGIRVYQKNVFALKEHIDRLYASARAIELKIPYGKTRMTENVIKTLRANAIIDGYIRLVVTRGPGDLGLDPRKCYSPTIFIIADRITLYPEELYQKGLSLIISKTRRNHPSSLNPNIKSLNYLNNILAKIEAIKSGVPEALMLSVAGEVAECTGENVFIAKNGALFTPPASVGALDGITQRKVLELAGRLRIKTAKKKIYEKDIYAADEMFLTGTAAEIVPVVRVNRRKIGRGVPGPIMKKLLLSFRQITALYGRKYKV